MLTLKTKKQTKLMDRLLSLLMAILLIGGIYFDSVNRVNNVSGNLGHHAPVGDSIGPGEPQGGQGNKGRDRAAIPESRPSPGTGNKNNDKSPGSSHGTAKVMSRLDRPADYRMEVTAYTSTGNPTKSGAWPTVGCVAVDPEVIPLGSELFVEGYGYAKALDTGADIKGKRMDLFMDTRDMALAYGRKFDVRVWVIK